MNCPGCGGSLKPVGNRNHLQCGHCGRYHFPDECDAGCVLTGEPSQLTCPVCEHQQLEAALMEGYAVHTCRNCRGLLSEMAAFARAVAIRRGKRNGASGESAAFDRRELQRTIKCPSCSQRMENYPYAGGGNAVVDSCSRCHFIWLDADELKVICSYSPAQTPKSNYVPETMSAEEELFRALMG